MSGERHHQAFLLQDHQGGHQAVFGERLRRVCLVQGWWDCGILELPSDGLATALPVWQAKNESAQGCLDPSLAPASQRSWASAEHRIDILEMPVRRHSPGHFPVLRPHCPAYQREGCAYPQGWQHLTLGQRKNELIDRKVSAALKSWLRCSRGVYAS